MASLASSSSSCGEVASAPAAERSSDAVGFAYQPEMLEHRGPSNKHPEKPERLTAVLDVLQTSGLLDRCVRLPARSATDEELLRVHTAKHLEHVAAAAQAVAQSPDDRSLQEPHGVDAIYYHAATERAARAAAGSVLQATERVLCGECRTAFALVRPPGHHAEAEEAIGFCFYNSAAVAAADALARRRVEKVVVVDWDVHHGNGTQHIFEDERRVLFISIHRFGSGFFPGSGALHEVGEGEGRGRTLNVPWQQTGLGDADYAAAFELVLMPVLRAFSEDAPTLLLVSAGFDAARGDLQGGMHVSPGGFAWMMRQLLTLPHCRPAVVFEGGYHLQASAACAEAVVRQLLSPPAAHAAAAGGASEGEDGGDAPAGSLCEHTEGLLRQVMRIHAEFWPCLATPAHRACVDDYFRRSSESSRRCVKRRQAQAQVAARPAAPKKEKKSKAVGSST